MNIWITWLSCLLVLTACSVTEPQVNPQENPTPAPATISVDSTSPTAAGSGTDDPVPSSTTTPEGPQGKADADVEFVRAVLAAQGTWTFHVTVHHPDTGWEDYADGWDVVTLEGQVLKPDPDSPFTRLLLHPHENEQPFTRSQSGIRVPDGVTRLLVRAHDLVHGFGGKEVLVDLETSSGEGFEIVR